MEWTCGCSSIFSRGLISSCTPLSSSARLPTHWAGAGNISRARYANSRRRKSLSRPHPESGALRATHLMPNMADDSCSCLQWHRRRRNTAGALAAPLLAVGFQLITSFFLSFAVVRDHQCPKCFGSDSAQGRDHSHRAESLFRIVNHFPDEEGRSYHSQVQQVTG